VCCWIVRFSLRNSAGFLLFFGVLFFPPAGRSGNFWNLGLYAGKHREPEVFLVVLWKYTGKSGSLEVYC
jgi:hypothetical protein